MKVKELIRELEYLDCNDATLVQCSNFDETDEFDNIYTKEINITLFWQHKTYAHWDGELSEEDEVIVNIVDI